MDDSMYRQRLDRVRAGMRQWGAELMFVNYGANMTYVAGLLTPIYYDILKGKGDWITGLLISLDRDPVLVLQQSFAINVEQETWIEDIRVLPAGQDPDAFLAKVLADFAADGKTIAVSKMLWGQTLLSLQAGAPGARFIPAGDDM
ncbi:MAG: aminopeptidase P family N-terminal domain-containing protein, partial [Caldilineaceae bacterium]|nr:aminopeptidase P family N-terminal domain-containing protein [Caldilineaceae bacterium]